MSISKEKPPESSGTESPDDVVMDSSFENEIFRFAEEKVGIIPKKLKNVMSICGFTSSTTISSISTEDIENMEQYMRELDPTVAPPTKDLYATPNSIQISFVIIGLVKGKITQITIEYEDPISLSVRLKYSFHQRFGLIDYTSKWFSYFASNHLDFDDDDSDKDDRRNLEREIYLPSGVTCDPVVGFVNPYRSVSSTKLSRSFFKFWKKNDFLGPLWGFVHKFRNCFR
ncbi:hypothetical protein DMENIID0001_009440 [Sergentomyia squamirostris]